jgi:NADH dehydrogenase
MVRVVIVGAGFAGLNAAKGLSRARDVQVTLIDRENHHLFQPLLYQVAMAALSPADIATPIRSLFAHAPNVRVLKEEAQHIDLARRCVVTDFAEHPYDYLVLASGAQHAYFGHEEWEPYAPGLKNLSQATEIRRRVLDAFEAAEREPVPERRRKYLTFVVATRSTAISAPSIRDKLASCSSKRVRASLQASMPTWRPAPCAIWNRSVCRCGRALQ